MIERGRGDDGLHDEAAEGPRDEHDAHGRARHAQLQVTHNLRLVHQRTPAGQGGRA